MTKNEFIKIVKLFLQNPEDIEAEKSFVTFKNGDAEYALDLSMDERGALMCKECGADVAEEAWSWIVRRLAHLDILAKAIAEATSECVTHYIPAPAQASISEKDYEVDDVVEKLCYQICKHDNFTTEVYYIIAEAGEGKSVIMNRLANKLALEYLERKQSRLFVPIELGGRPFMRLDEVILGTLSRKFRYHSCYLESFIELVRRGVVVLGLDGFEEMAVQGAEGDIVSSLGNLIRDFDSRGQVVFSTRTAYYVYTSLNSKVTFAELFTGQEVVINEFRLKKWGCAQFAALMQSYGWNAAEADRYSRSLQEALGEGHPIMTRAVLAHMLVHEWYDSFGTDAAIDVDQIIDRFRGVSVQDAISRFVELLIKREETKWITKDECARPLLSNDQHVRLMAAIADEMWLSECDSLSTNVLLDITELLCEDFGLSPADVHQCKERVFHHVLLSPEGKSRLKFCHNDFYHFFFGVSLSFAFLEERSEFRLRKLLDRRIVLYVSACECVRRINISIVLDQVVEQIRSLVKGASRATFLNQNLSALLLLLADANCKLGDRLENLFCAQQFMERVSLDNVVLVDCYIESISSLVVTGHKMRFENCDIALLRLPVMKGVDFSGLSFDMKSVPRLIRREYHDGRVEFRDPSAIQNQLMALGANIDGMNTDGVVMETESDDLLLFFKVVNIFNKRMTISDNLLKTKLGVRYPDCSQNILPLMLRSRVLVEHQGRDCVAQYKLGMSLEELNELRVKATGSYEKLKNLLCGN